MRKIVIGMDAGQCGTDAWEFYIVPDSMTDAELSDFAWQCGKTNAEMYGIYPKSEYQGDSEISDEELEGDDYSDNIEGWVEEYEPEKHDGYSMTGTPHWTEL